MSGSELNGDIRLAPWDRLRYLARNLKRNLRHSGTSLRATPFCRGRVGNAEGTPSPGRLIGHVFIGEVLPQLLSQRDIRVLDIGCGTGRMSRHLSDAGFGGSYVGIDIDDRFFRGAEESDTFARRFILGDAHDLPESESYDLIFSSSALEHIPDDRKLLTKLSRLVTSDGLQVHMVPGAWGLPLYLWHGYRQYSLSRIGSLFPAANTKVYGLGGFCCFLLHLVFISLGEIIFRLKLRRRAPHLYRTLLNRAVAVDRWLPFCPAMYAICCRGSGSAESLPTAKSKGDGG